MKSDRLNVERSQFNDFDAFERAWAPLFDVLYGTRENRVFGIHK